MKSPFSKSMINRLVAAIQNAESETFEDYINNQIKEEDAVSGNLASKIEDECNRVLKEVMFTLIGVVVEPFLPAEDVIF